MQLFSLIFIRWIAIYPVDSAIQHLNIRGQEHTHISLAQVFEHLAEDRKTIQALLFRLSSGIFLPHVHDMLDYNFHLFCSFSEKLVFVVWVIGDVSVCA